MMFMPCPNPLPPSPGIRVLEFAGLGPAPYAGMLLADLGADVLCIERRGGAELFPVRNPTVDRGKRFLSLDLKDASAVDLCLRIAEKADVLIEGFRPRSWSASDLVQMLRSAAIPGLFTRA